MQEPLERKLYPGMAPSGEPKVDLTADQFARFEEMHGADQMAVDKLKVRLEVVPYVRITEESLGSRFP